MAYTVIAYIVVAYIPRRIRSRSSSETSSKHLVKSLNTMCDIVRDTYIVVAYGLYLGMAYEVLAYIVIWPI